MCKLKYVEWIVRRSYDPSNAYTLCLKIRDTLKSLFEHYSKRMPQSQNKSCFKTPDSSTEAGGSESHCGETKKLRGTNLKKDFEIEEEQRDDPINETQLDRYLADNRARDPNNDFDILSWWCQQSNSYPILRTMARDVLAIPVSTVASESAFSTRGRVLDSFRTSLTPRMVEALICTQDWIRNSHFPIKIKESLLELEEMEQEGMKDLTKEQPTITIDEMACASDASDLTYDVDI